MSSNVNGRLPLAPELCGAVLARIDPVKASNRKKVFVVITGLGIRNLCKTHKGGHVLNIQHITYMCVEY